MKQNTTSSDLNETLSLPPKKHCQLNCTKKLLTNNNHFNALQKLQNVSKLPDNIANIHVSSSWKGYDQLIQKLWKKLLRSDKHIDKTSIKSSKTSHARKLISFMINNHENFWQNVFSFFQVSILNFNETYFITLGNILILEVMEKINKN